MRMRHRPSKHWYTRYVDSQHWKRWKRLIREKYANKCARCKSYAQLHVHHRTYERLGCEEEKDLVLLCGMCHRSAHQYTIIPYIEVLRWDEPPPAVMEIIGTRDVSKFPYEKGSGATATMPALIPIHSPSYDIIRRTIDVLNCNKTSPAYLKNLESIERLTKQIDSH